MNIYELVTFLIAASGICACVLNFI